MNRCYSAQHLRPSSARSSIQTPSQFFVNNSNARQFPKHPINQQQKEYESKKNFNTLRQTFNLENDAKEYTCFHSVLINQGFYDHNNSGQKRIIKKKRNAVNEFQPQHENTQIEHVPAFTTTYSTQFKPEITQCSFNQNKGHFQQEVYDKQKKNKKKAQRNSSCILQQQQQLQTQHKTQQKEQKLQQSQSKGKLMEEIERNNKAFFDHQGGQCDCVQCECGNCRCYWMQQNKPLLSTMHLTDAAFSQYQVEYLDKTHNNLQLKYYPSTQPLRKSDGQPILTETKRQFCKYNNENYRYKKEYDCTEKPLPQYESIQQKTQYEHQYKLHEPYKQEAAMQQSKNFQFIPGKTVITQNVPLQNKTHYKKTFQPIESLQEEVEDANEQCIRNLNVKDPSSPMREAYIQENLQSVAHSELNEKQIELDERYQPKLSVQYPSFNDQFVTMHKKNYKDCPPRMCKVRQNSKKQFPLRIYN